MTPGKMGNRGPVCGNVFDIIAGESGAEDVAIGDEKGGAFSEEGLLGLTLTTAMGVGGARTVGGELHGTDLTGGTPGAGRGRGRHRAHGHLQAGRR